MTQPTPASTKRDAGFFVAFEGPEGAGKSTQIEAFVARLQAAGVSPVQTREPGGTRAGDRIRGVILDPDLDIAPLTEFLLYSASRAQLVRERIAPALQGGRTVVTDRFSGASLAYQGYGRGLDRAFIEALSRRATDGLVPDVTILLDIAVDEGMRRVAQRGARDRLEQATSGFHERVRTGFLDIASREPSWHVVDATENPAIVAERIWKVVSAVHPELGGAHGPDVVRPDDAP